MPLAPSSPVPLPPPALVIWEVMVEPPSLIRDKVLGGNGNASVSGGGHGTAVGGPEPSVPSSSIGGGGGGETVVEDVDSIEG